MIRCTDWVVLDVFSDIEDLILGCPQMRSTCTYHIYRSKNDTYMVLMAQINVENSAVVQRVLCIICQKTRDSPCAPPDRKIPVGVPLRSAGWLPLSRSSNGFFTLQGPVVATGGRERVDGQGRSKEKSLAGEQAG